MDLQLLSIGDFIQVNKNTEVIVELPWHFVDSGHVGDFSELMPATVRAGIPYNGMDTEFLLGAYVVTCGIPAQRPVFSEGPPEPIEPFIVASKLFSKPGRDSVSGFEIKITEAASIAGQVEKIKQTGDTSDNRI